MRQLGEEGVSTKGTGPAMGSVYDFVVGSWFVGISHSVKWKMTALATVIFLYKTT